MGDTNYRNYPYVVAANTTDQTIKLGVFDWLEDNVGEYYVDWNYSGFDFFFKHERDAMLFTLRWA